MSDYKTYDLIIAGGGTAGCIVAARVAERGVNPKTGEKLKIAMIEAGPYWKGEQRAGYGQSFRRQRTTQMIWEEFYGVPTFPWMFGLSMVGGCSMHWGANSFLPLDIDYQHWVQETGVDWTKEKMKEAVEDVVDVYHVHENPDEGLAEGDWLFKKAAESLGHGPVRKYQVARKNCIFCGFRGDGHGCKYDARGTSLWYMPIAERNGVEVIPNAMIQKVLIERKGAKGVVNGVVYKENGVTKEARADKVVVSCGYAGTPVLLGRSGYGPKEVLGDQMIVENANVGRNLDGDTRYRIPAFFDRPIREESGRGGIGAFYFYNDVGPDAVWRMRIASAGMGLVEYPHSAALSELAPDFGKAHMDYMRTAVRQLGSLDATVTKPASSVKGMVNLRTGAKTYPKSDMITKRMNEGFDIIREIYKKIGAKKVGERVPKSFESIGGGHTNGTCRAGTDRKNSVIDSKFESHDVEGLFISDASAIPRAVSNNVGITAAIMGAYAARRIVDAYFKRGA